MISTAVETRSVSTDRLLFVTGIPSRASLLDLETHFSRFGKVTILKLTSLRKGGRVVPANPISNIRRGFCVLSTEDKATFDAIMGSSSVLFEERELLIGRFRQGAELESYNTYVSSRRVLLKKVPTTIDQQILRCLIEERFGATARMYRYGAESRQKADRKDWRRPHYTYCVDFEAVSSANHATAIRRLELPQIGCSIQIDRYNRRGNSSKPRNTRNTASKLQDDASNQRISHLQTHNELVCAVREVTDARANLQKDRNLIHSKLWQDDAQGINHVIKPTSRSYFAIHRPLQKSLQYGLEDQMVRLNILRRVCRSYRPLRHGVNRGQVSAPRESFAAESSTNTKFF